MLLVFFSVYFLGFIETRLLYSLDYNNCSLLRRGIPSTSHCPATLTVLMACSSHLRTKRPYHISLSPLISSQLSLGKSSSLFYLPLSLYRSNILRICFSILVPSSTVSYPLSSLAFSLLKLQGLPSFIFCRLQHTPIRYLTMDAACTAPLDPCTVVK